MTETIDNKAGVRLTNKLVNRAISSIAVAAILACAGCISVTAPDKPIVINLNISVTQEVVYRLDGQAKNLIQANPGIF